VAEVARLGRFAEDHGFEEAEREQALAAVAGTG